MVASPVLTPLERASNLVTGGAAAPDASVRHRPGEGPRRALEDAVVPALARGRCVVAFSGGRDSSLVLAVAARAARRHGLPLPVPFTLRYPGHPCTDEHTWQELVVRHLCLPDWEISEVGDELGLTGPVAGAGLLRHGVLFPPNAHTIVPPARAAGPGGTVLVGVDGDGLFATWRWAAAARHRVRSRRRPLTGLRPRALASLPPQARAMVLSSRPAPELPWLNADAAADAAWAWTAERAAEPTRWDRRVAWHAGRRFLRLTVNALRTLAGDVDASVGFPLLDPAFLSALASAGGRDGLGTRTEAMRHLAADLLPGSLLARPSKALFGPVFWTEEVRALCRDWDGDGLDADVADLVDPEALRCYWAGAWPPRPGTASLVQTIWLARNRRLAAARPAAATGIAGVSLQVA